MGDEEKNSSARLQARYDLARGRKQTGVSLQLAFKRRSQYYQPANNGYLLHINSTLTDSTHMGWTPATAAFQAGVVYLSWPDRVSFTGRSPHRKRTSFEHVHFNLDVFSILSIVKQL